VPVTTLMHRPADSHALKLDLERPCAMNGRGYRPAGGDGLLVDGVTAAEQPCWHAVLKVGGRKLIENPSLTSCSYSGPAPSARTPALSRTSI